MPKSKNSYFTPNQGGLFEPKDNGLAEPAFGEPSGGFIVLGWGEEFLSNCPAPAKKPITKPEAAKEEL